MGLANALVFENPNKMSIITFIYLFSRDFSNFAILQVGYHKIVT